MSARDEIVDQAPNPTKFESATDLLRPLVESAPASPLHSPSCAGVLIGELLAIRDDGRSPLVRYAGQPGTAALAARSTVDLHGAHIGRHVVLMFEAADPLRPIVMGVLRDGERSPMGDGPGQVEVDADGERMQVSAKEQLVLRCGKASITLTRAGKVLIKGNYVLSRSAGVNRIKGGSVQLN
ncbi:MAG: hypothetical protein KDF95_10960 [Rhodocyclaceae bacterium]|nr:hypothetical protein [Rhodocyclaceae bacterium]